MSLKTERQLIRAKKLVKKGKFDKAKEIYTSILKISPNNQIAKNEFFALEQIQVKNPAKAQLDNVMDLYSSGHIKESLSAVNLMIQDHPNEPILFNISGACFSSIGPIDSAIQAFKKAISLKPEYSEAHYNLGVVFQKNRQNDDSVCRVRPRRQNNYAVWQSGLRTFWISSYIFRWICMRYSFCSGHRIWRLCNVRRGNRKIYFFLLWPLIAFEIILIKGALILPPDIALFSKFEAMSTIFIASLSPSLRSLSRLALAKSIAPGFTG